MSIVLFLLSLRLVRMSGDLDSADNVMLETCRKTISDLKAELRELKTMNKEQCPSSQTLCNRGCPVLSEQEMRNVEWANEVDKVSNKCFIIVGLAGALWGFYLMSLSCRGRQ